MNKITIFLLMLWGFCIFATCEQDQQIETLTSPHLYQPKIVLVGIDGADTTTFQEILNSGEVPSFKKLWDESAHTLETKGEYPSDSVTGWNAALYGKKAWLFEKLTKLLRYKYPATFTGEVWGGPQSAFKIVKTHIVEAKTAMIAGWGQGLLRLVPKEDIDYLIPLPDSHLTLYEAEGRKQIYDDSLTEICTKPYRFAFIHFNEADEIGHDEGINDHYKKALKETMEYIAELRNKINPKDYLCVVSDHGRDSFNCCFGRIRQGYSHDAFWSARTRNVPLLFSGPGINPKANISGSSIADVAPTLLTLLGIPKNGLKTMNGKSLVDEILCSKTGKEFPE